MDIMRSVVGMVVLLAIAFLLSVNKKSISLRTVGAALLLQIAIGGIMLYFPPGKWAVEQAALGVHKVMSYSDAGSAFIFGSLVGPKMDVLFDGAGFIFAFRVLPAIIFVTALISLLYYIGVMGLDLTNQTVCTPDVIARMERAGGPAGELFSDIMNFTLKTQFENYGLAGGPVHDATCIGYLINPDGIKTQDMYVEVDVNSGPCYGRTVCDELGVLGKPANTKVGITIDTDWFWGLVEECVRGYIKTH